jgi:hypothetical protein
LKWYRLSSGRLILPVLTKEPPLQAANRHADDEDDKESRHKQQYSSGISRSYQTAAGW